MSTTSKNIRIPYPTEGVIRSAQLNDTVAPEDSCELAVNINFDRIGAFQTRAGVTYLGAIGGNPGPVAGMGVMAIQATGSYGIFAQVGTDIQFSTDGTTWSSVRTLSTNANKARFSQFLNYVWMVNGNNGDAVGTSNGGAFGTTLIPAGFPKGDFIQAGFEGRVWVADKSTDTLYYTDIVQFTPPSTYSLTFTLATNFIQNLSPQDGESITGLFRVPRALLVFKQNHIYRVYGAFSVDSYPAYNVGTYSQESIVQTKDGIYFHHSSGIYQFNYDGQPTEISRRVIDFIKAIPRSNYEKVVGNWDGFDTIEWFIGPVTVEEVTYTNCVLRYTISTQVWTTYDYIDQTFSAAINFRNATDFYRVGLNSVANVVKIGTGETDQGEPIYFEYIDRWRSFTEMYAHAKALSGMAIYSKNGAGAQVQYQTDKDGVNVWTDIDSIDENYVTLFPNMSTTDFNRFRFRIKGYTSGTPIIFDGVELLSLQDKGYNQN